MTEDNGNRLGKILKERRAVTPLTLKELEYASGVSQSYLSRIERGERFPSASILRKIAKSLDFEESELLILGGYLSPQSSVTIDSKGQGGLVRLDPYVARVLASEPTYVQFAVIEILAILKIMAERADSNIGFTEYARSKYLGLGEGIIKTMIKDMVEHPQRGVVMSPNRAKSKLF